MKRPFDPLSPRIERRPYPLLAIGLPSASTQPAVFESRGQAFSHQARSEVWDTAFRSGHQMDCFLYDQSSHISWSYCLACGRRTKIDGKTQSCSADGLDSPCQPNALKALESWAILIGEIPGLLEKRLQAEFNVLGDSMREQFLHGSMQLEKRRLVSRDGILALVWKLREFPDQPIGRNNPQTPQGLVEMKRLVPELALRKGRYVGPRFNPNGTEDRALWTAIPLETNERGWIYRDDIGQARFRREDGIVGYIVPAYQLVYEDGHPFPVLPGEQTDDIPVISNVLTLFKNEEQLVNPAPYYP